VNELLLTQIKNSNQTIKGSISENDISEQLTHEAKAAQGINQYLGLTACAVKLLVNILLLLFSGRLLALPGCTVVDLRGCAPKQQSMGA
jgi:hypothetical protein